MEGLKQSLWYAYAETVFREKLTLENGNGLAWSSFMLPEDSGAHILISHWS